MSPRTKFDKIRTVSQGTGKINNRWNRAKLTQSYCHTKSPSVVYYYLQRKVVNKNGAQEIHQIKDYFFLN